MADIYAHSLTDEHGFPLSCDLWETLEDHLHVVAERAAEFATRFDAAEWGAIAIITRQRAKSVLVQRFLSNRKYLVPE
jgi:hypothetical protein